jgi:prephenate dehydrogenase
VSSARRAAIVGTGLIGSSIGLGLRQHGWYVSGLDDDPAVAERARELGAVDVVGPDPAAELTFVATPVGAVAAVARALLEDGAGVVTDVGGVKAPVVDAVGHARFVGGHPMAGSEQDGVDGARADLFEGATWVLTPDAATDESAYALVRSVVSGLGADVVALAPERHDALVAIVSHVPHLTAATLMGLADERADEHRALLRLAAGGFRDMTRIAAGHPGIWPDVCNENREAVVDGLDRLITALTGVRDVVDRGDRAGLLRRLEAARVARTNLPPRYARPDDLTELRLPIPDRPGALAEVTTTATELDVNIFDLEIAHSTEGGGGVLIVLVEASAADPLADALEPLGYHVTGRRDLT